MKANTSYTQQNIHSTKILEKLSSGKEVNRAADNVSGMAISEKMKAQIRGLEQAAKNTDDGISLTQVAQGGLQQINDLLHRMRELAVNMASDTYTAADRAAANLEFSGLKDTIDQIANNTEFNTIHLLNVAHEVTVDPTEELLVGTITITADMVAANPVFSIKMLFGTIDGSQWPDLNIAAPNGDRFGYEWTYIGGSNEQTLTGGGMTASDSVWYTGWEGDMDGNEEMRFTNPILGTWQIFARNTGGTKSSTFGVESNYPFDGLNINRILSIHVGANTNQAIPVELVSVTQTQLGLSAVSVLTREEANTAINRIDTAAATVSRHQTKFGVAQNRLEHVYDYTNYYCQNIQRAQSSIEDASIASNAMKLAKYQLLSEAAKNMLASANQTSQSILQILR
jgi:flagellin